MSKAINSGLSCLLFCTVSLIAFAQSADKDAEIESAAAQVDSALSSGSARQLELLQFRTEQLAGLRDELSKLSDMQETIATQNAEMTSLKSEIDLLKQAMNTTNNENDQLKEAVDTASSENEQLKEAVSTANSENEKLKETVATFETDLTSIKASAEDADTTTSSLKKKNESLEQLLAEKEKLLGTLSLRVKQEEKKSESVSEIRKAYFNLKEANAALVGKLESQQNSSENIAKSTDAYKQQITELELELASLRRSDENKISRVEFERNNTEKQSLSETVSQLKLQVKQLETQNEERSEMLSDFGITDSSLVGYLSATREATAQQENSERRIVVMQAELTNLRGANSQLERKLAELKTDTTPAFESKVDQKPSVDPVTKPIAIAPNAETDDTKTGGAKSAAANTAPPSNASISAEKSVEAAVLALSENWSIRIGNNGPVDYIDLAAAKLQKNNLPGESDCQDFVQQFNNDKKLLDRLSVNGFPVTVFWIQRKNGAFAICKIDKSSANIFRASVSRAAPSRADKAIAPRVQ